MNGDNKSCRYTEIEKRDIATEHLISKQMKAHGLKDTEFSINENGLLEIIKDTHEKLEFVI